MFDLRQLNPFKTRKRASSGDYSALILDTLFKAATGGTTDPAATAVLEACAGVWGRSLASALVTPAVPALSPRVLHMVGRQLLRRGEVVFLIGMRGDGRITLTPSSSWDIEGDADPESWVYRLDLLGPSNTRVVKRPAEAVLHFRYATDPRAPWKGLSPLGAAFITGRLLSGLEKRLSEEAGAVTGSLIPIPVNGQDDEDEDDPNNPTPNVVDDMQKQLSTLDGLTAMVPTVAEGWGEGKPAAPQGDWLPRRIGMNLPATTPQLRGMIEACVLSACGVSPSLFQPNADGTSQRESYRRLIYQTIAPVSRLIAEEAQTKLAVTDVQFDFSELRANDLQGQARAWRMLAGRDAMMSPERASQLVKFDA